MSFKKPILIAAATIALLSGVAAVSHSIAQTPANSQQSKAEDGKKEGYGYGRGGFVPDYIKELDKNNDGVITKEESDLASSERLKKFDKSGKGQLTRADTEAMVREQLEKQVQRMTDGIFRSADTNNDGVISKEEWAASQQKRFERMDKNKDGKIDADEMKRGGRGKYGRGGDDESERGGKK